MPANSPSPDRGRGTAGAVEEVIVCKLSSKGGRFVESVPYFEKTIKSDVYRTMNTAIREAVLCRQPLTK